MATKTEEQDSSTSDQPDVSTTDQPDVSTTDKKSDDSAFSEEERTPVEEMTTLGQCRYCESDAVRMAPHKDGTGWIAICDDHEKEAHKDDFEPEKEQDASVSGS